jgi:methanogenic corrinoid protein MtbC1
MTVTKKHVLVVDDELLLVRLNKRRLENEGYRVSVSTTSRDALDLVQKDPGKFDLLLTDLAMPGISGIELIKKILQLVPTLPVIVLTGMKDSEIERELEDLGVKAVLDKPLVDNVLPVTVWRVLAEAEAGKPTNKKLANMFVEALLEMDKDAAFALSREHDNHHTLVEEIIVPCLKKIGTSWEDGRIALTQVYISAQICEEILVHILPVVDRSDDSTPNIALVLLEDYHVLGKMIVKSSLIASGHSVLDLGRMTVDEIVAAVKKENIKILLVSVLMLPSALRVKDLRKRFDQERLETKIVVGGAPFRLDKNIWREVGADAYGTVASDCIQIVNRLVGECR